MGSKVLDLSRRYALTWKGDPKGDPATVWRIEPTDAKARGDGVIRVRICNEQRGEYLYVGSKLLDPDRRLALTWVGDANDDEAMLWDIVPAPGGQNAREGVSFPPICRIRNAATDEYLYVGSSMLDAARRYALTWVGEANSDPAMVWEFVNPPSTAKAAPSAATTDASTHMSKPSPSKDSKKSESPSVPALPPPTPLPVGAAAKRKSRPTCTFLPEVKNSQALRSLHTGPTPTSNWVVPGRLIASENPTFYENEPTAASNIKRIVGAGARVFVCLHKHRISARSSYMRSAWALLSPQERGSLEFVSFPIGDMQTRTDKELDSFTDRIANSILTRPKLVHFVHWYDSHSFALFYIQVLFFATDARSGAAQYWGSWPHWHRSVCGAWETLPYDERR